MKAHWHKLAAKHLGREEESVLGTSCWRLQYCSSKLDYSLPTIVLLWRQSVKVVVICLYYSVFYITRDSKWYKWKNSHLKNIGTSSTKVKCQTYLAFLRASCNCSPGNRMLMWKESSRNCMDSHRLACVLQNCSTSTAHTNCLSIVVAFL